MENILLLNYSVKGIKVLEEEVSLSFYKKFLTFPLNRKSYNIKGIYGMNGSGKSAIITSFDILKHLLVDESYLSNPIIQKNLNELINKKTETLGIKVSFLINRGKKAFIIQYEVEIQKASNGKFEIVSEALSCKPSSSSNENFNLLIQVKDGEIETIVSNKKNDIDLMKYFKDRTRNLLSVSGISALFIEKIDIHEETKHENRGFLFMGLTALYLLGRKIHVYIDDADDHTFYFLSDFLKTKTDFNFDDDIMLLLDNAIQKNKNELRIFSNHSNIIRKEDFPDFEKEVARLQGFLQIFKPELQKILIEKKEDKDMFVCNLNMRYQTYTVNSEFESTGIKKLIKLFSYLRNMVQGDIVFIDEFDSNLHDVYLCALLEYLMDFGKGQLCFTSHNVGPMEVLKRNKRAIDFLSEDHQIYSWKTNGNYSPSKLYKNGMIEGSPFNVDSIDFIGILDSTDEED